MASLALRLHQKPSQTVLKSTPTLTLSHLFSSSSNNKDDENPPNPPNFSSYFSDIKSRLNNQQQQQQSPASKPFNFSPPQNPPKVASFDEIRKNLSEFRRRSTVPSSESQSSQNPTLLQDLYKRNVNLQNPNPNPQNVQKNISFETIRESLRQLRVSKGEKSGSTDSKVNDRMSLEKYKENFSLNPNSMGGNRIYNTVGSSAGLPASVFGKEMKEKEKEGGVSSSSAEEEDETEFVWLYSHEELGEKLRDLRPDAVKKPKKGDRESGFSLGELNDRLKKLRKIEMKQSSRVSALSGELRKTIKQLKDKNDEPASSFQKFDLFGQISRSPSFMQSPPKEHLVEKYFHPDNMSSEEKLKLELKKVRDEFKMHESDCGSARVQIAQLTTEILHLSSVLHKKDKHSRRGLLAKVQQRKKLLKYLRRTDWDSYCFVLSKLGLRDNPDYKN